MARRKKKIKVVHTVVQQCWEESERGWGVRPDGFSYHKNESDRFRFVYEYEISLPEYVPDEYSRVCGSPTFVDVSDDVFKKIQAADFGLRTYKNLTLI